VRRGIFLPLLLAIVGPRAWAGAPAGRAEALVRAFHLSEADLALLGAGKVVTRDLPAKDDNDVAIVGAARIDAPERTLLEDPRELEVFLKDGPILQAGTFSSPPSVDDLAGLSLDAKDLRLSQRCRPGDCDFQLDAGGMDSVRRADWRAGSKGPSFLSLWKEAIVETITSYQRDGRMAVYLDNQPAESVREALERSLADSPYLPLDTPFMRYLLDYPNAPLADTEDVFYWTKERVREPVVSLHHLVIHKDLDGKATDYVIADKHISDSHYFLATVELVWLIDEPGDKASFWAVRLNRTRIDPPREMRGILLGRIRKGMRKAMHQSLTDTKLSLEAMAP